MQQILINIHKCAKSSNDTFITQSRKNYASLKYCIKRRQVMVAVLYGKYILMKKVPSTYTYIHNIHISIIRHLLRDRRYLAHQTADRFFSCDMLMWIMTGSTKHDSTFQINIDHAFNYNNSIQIKVHSTATTWYMHLIDIYNRKSVNLHLGIYKTTHTYYLMKLLKCCFLDQSNTIRWKRIDIHSLWKNYKTILRF